MRFIITIKTVYTIMSRVLRYQNSFNRFISDRNCYENLSDELINIINTNIKDDQCIIPIITLTVMGSRKKKNNNNLSYQIYYAAVAADFIRIMYFNNKYIKKSGLSEISISNVYKFWNINIDKIKKKVSNDKIIKMNNLCLESISNRLININTPIKYEYTENKITDLHRNFLKKKNNNLIEKFKNTKLLKKECLFNIIKQGICKVIECSMLIGWYIGCGTELNTEKIIKLAEDFGFMYKISEDFKNIEKDLEELNSNTTESFVINFGLQQSFEEFNERKDRFIENAMLLEILSPTLTEIITILEDQVEVAINTTSPDLKSTYSTIN